jgi:hypothetical protein
VWANKTWLPLATLKGHDNKERKGFPHFLIFSFITLFTAEFSTSSMLELKEKWVRAMSLSSIVELL